MEPRGDVHPFLVRLSFGLWVVVSHLASNEQWGADWPVPASVVRSED